MRQQITDLKVFLRISSEPLLVGRLAYRNGEIYFEYDASFISSGLEISPFHLPLKEGVFKGKNDLFEGLPGVFNDSLPDGWGRLLLDRRLRKKGIEPGSTGALDRLAFTGRQGMGALSYEPDKSDGEMHEVIDLETIKNEIDDLKKLGLSSGLKQSLIDATLDKISYCAAQWEMYCDKSEIPKEIKERVQSRFILK